MNDCKLAGLRVQNSPSQLWRAGVHPGPFTGSQAGPLAASWRPVTTGLPLSLPVHRAPVPVTHLPQPCSEAPRIALGACLDTTRLHRTVTTWNSQSQGWGHTRARSMPQSGDTNGVRRVTEPPGRDHPSGQLQHSTGTLPTMTVSRGSDVNGCTSVSPKGSGSFPSWKDGQVNLSWEHGPHSS